MLTDLAQAITSKWWTFLLRGIFALILAVAVFMYPGATATALVYLVAAYFIVAGFAQVAGGIAFTGVGQSWLLLLTGAMSIFLGFIMLTQPGMGPLALAYLVAVYAIFNGIAEITSGIALRDVMQYAGWITFLGIVTLALGVYIIINPALGVAALVYAIGFYAVIAAIALFVFAFRLKSAGSQVTGQVSAS